MDRVHSDVFFGILDGRRLGEQPDGSLGSVVGRGALATHQSVYGRYVNDGASTNLAHLRYDMLGSQKRTLGVDVHLGIPYFLGGVLDAGPCSGACVVDQNVHPTVSGYCGSHGVHPFLLVGDIQPPEQSIATGLVYLGGSLLAGFLVDIG